MTGAAKRKGDDRERQAAAEIHALLGFPARRMLGAGRLDDVGDIDGVPEGDERLRIMARDPVVWRRLAAACANLAAEQEAALRPPPHRDLS